jgi:gluconate 5-dehydrogenase
VAIERNTVEVNILINNAGIQLRKPLVELESENWQRVMDANLASCHLIAPPLPTPDGVDN